MSLWLLLLHYSSHKSCWEVKKNKEDTVAARATQTKSLATRSCRVPVVSYSEAIPSFIA